MNMHNLGVPIVCLALLVSPGAWGATLEGQTFDDGILLAKSELRLNGLGVRAVLFIKGYVAGLYLNQKAASLQEVKALSGPKRLQLRMLRSAGSADFNSALVSGIRQNANESELARLTERIGQLERTIQTIGIAAPGDVINFDYVPGLGTTLAVNGTNKGPAIAGADFYSAVLGIFVGDNPVDTRLKRGLLGQ